MYNAILISRFRSIISYLCFISKSMLCYIEKEHNVTLCEVEGFKSLGSLPFCSWISLSLCESFTVCNRHYYPHHSICNFLESSRKLLKEASVYGFIVSLLDFVNSPYFPRTYSIEQYEIQEHPYIARYHHIAWMIHSI